MITPKFWDELVLRRYRSEWRLAHEFRFDSAVMGCRIVVDEGFVTDLASVPRFPFAYWLAGGSAEAAAVLHDWMYRMKLQPREKCDALFLEAMRTDGSNVNIPAEPYWRSSLMWAAVRVGGWLSWGRE